MKPIVLICSLLLILPLTACSSGHYGISDEEWLHMSKIEKVAVIQGYNERQRIREQRRLEEEKRNRIMQEQQAQKRREYVAAVYNGTKGQFGDLLRVSMKGGQVKINGKHRSYRPVSFKIADKECKAVPLIHEKKFYSFSGRLNVCYFDGTLLIDTGNNNSYGAASIIYDPAWIKGKTYMDISSNGRIKIRKATFQIQIITASRRSDVIEHIHW